MNCTNFLHKHSRELPLLLLIVSCGISSGTLMLVSFLLHIILCRYYKEPILGPLLYSHKFYYSLIFIVIAFGSALITIPFNNGNLPLLLKYLGRIAPFFLIILMAKPSMDNAKVAWYGILVATFCLLLSILWTPIWKGGRLYGPFGNCNTLAGLIVTILPVLLYGMIKYRKNIPHMATVAGILGIGALVAMVCTGSRNAYGTFIIIFLCLAWIVYHYHDLFSFKIMITAVCVAILALGIFAPTITHRLGNNLQQDGRVYLMQSGLQIAKEHPLVGIGVGNWGKVYKEQFEATNPKREKDIQSPHNIYLQILDETGIVGLSGFLALIFFQFKVLYTSTTSQYKRFHVIFPWTIGFGLSITSIYIFGLLDYDFFSRQIMQLYWLFWGLCLCATEFTKRSNQ